MDFASASAPSTEACSPGVKSRFSRCAVDNTAGFLEQRNI